MNELFSGMELNEMGESSAMREIRGQIQEYQSKLTAAMNEGDAESANYFRGMIEKMNEVMDTHQGKVAGIGAEKLESQLGYNPEELRTAQSRLLSAKRELSTLESQRKGRTEDTELEKRIYKKKQEVEKLEREYKKAQYYNRPQIRGGDEGLGTHQGTENGTELGTHQGSDGQEISFGGGAGVTEIIHHNGSMKISEANSKRSTAAIYESDARRARTDGNFSKASSLESRAQSLRSEANRLEAEGKKLKAYKPK